MIIIKERAKWWDMLELSSSIPGSQSLGQLGKLPEVQRMGWVKLQEEDGSRKWDKVQ